MHKTWEPKNACEKLLHPGTAEGTGSSSLPHPPWGHLHPGEAGTLLTQGQEEQGMALTSKKPPSKATTPGDHPGAWPGGDVTTTVQGLGKSP